MNEHENKITLGELWNKRLVLITLCAITSVFAATVCSMVLRSMEIPDSLDRLITFAVGNLTGILTNTGLNRPSRSTGAVEVRATEPLPVIEQTEEKT